MINHEHKCIFIHIPKTSGRSIEKFLNRRLGSDDIGKRHGDGTLADCHISLARYYERYSKSELKDYFKFTIVRNTFDRMVSEYFFARLCNQTCSDFKGFVKKNEIENCYKYHDLLQTDFFINQGIDFIGRFENLQEDFNIVCDIIGIERKKLPHRNSTNHKHYTEYYDDETRQIVAERYAKDIEYFGYNFGD